MFRNHGLTVIGDLIPIRPRREYLVGVTLAASSGLAAWGLGHSDILTNPPWGNMQASQVGFLGLTALVGAILSILVEWRWRVRLEIGLAATAGLALVNAFGPGAAVTLTVFLMSATALGSLVIHRTSSSAPLPLVFITTLGAAIYCIVLTLLSSLPVNTFVLHVALLLAPTLALAMVPCMRGELLARIAALRGAARKRELRSWPETAGLIVLLFFVLFHAYLAALPERYWDAMVFHLYIPSFVAANRAWSYDASLYAWAFMPAGVDWLYTHFFLIKGERATHLYDFTAFMLVCAASYAIFLRFATRETAIWIVVLFASTPLVVLESATLFIEHTLTLWILSAVGLLLISDLRPDGRHVTVCLVFLAAAAVSKLHGAIAAAVTGPVLMLLFLRQRPGATEMAGITAVTILLAALACFPYAFSWIKTGNPLFPFYNDIFKSEFFPPISFRDTRWMGRFDWDLLYAATFASGNYLEARTGALGLTALLLVPLSLAAVLARPTAAGVLCLLLAAAIALPIISQIQYLRYFYPVFPLLLIPAGIGLTILTERTVSRALTLSLLATVTAFNLYKVPSAGWLLTNFDLRAAFDPVARFDFELTQAPERLANQAINLSAGRNARVLYNSATPYGALLQGVALYPNWYNGKLAEASAAVATPEQAKALLANWSVTHVVHSRVANDRGFVTVGSYLAANFRPIATFGSVDVYDVRPGR